METKEFYTCTIIGHRKVVDNINEKLKSVLENLIKKEKVKEFLFGSKSEFNDIAHEIVTELKSKHNLVRVGVLCKTESKLLEEERVKYEELFSLWYKKECHFVAYDKFITNDVILSARKNSYIVRNKFMIDNADYCVFYYREGLSKYGSGTKIALEYAKKKEKKIIII